MKHGARNNVVGKVTEIKKGDVMAHVRFEVTQPGQMSSVLTTDSLESLGLQVGDEVTLLVKAVHVLPVKNS